MTTQCHHPSPGTANVAEQELHDSSGADNLHALGLLRPTNGVTEGGGALATGVLDERLRDLQPLFARHPADTLDHFWGVACEVAAHDLEDAVRMLQGGVDQRSPILIALVVPTALIGVGFCFRIIAGEEAIQVFRIAVVLTDKRGGVGIVHHVVVEVQVVLQQVADDRAQENNIAACPRRHIEVRQGRGARVMRIYMHDFGPALFGFDHVSKGDGMGFGHVAAHDQDSIAIDEILREGRGAATPQCGTQTGHGGAVTTLGRGGATTFPQDLVNSDAILIMGSNMAEAHPVAFPNVLKAKEKGAPVIHIDPHFSRTSALANLYIPTRAGSDIVFLGAVIRYLLENNAYFHEYVLHYTNAAMLIRDDYRDTEDLNGLFSGYDPQTQTYADQSSWDYQYDEHGNPLRDDTLQHPQCVLQILRRHFARYTPEMVEEVCGVPHEQWMQVVRILVENSGRERTTALCYAVGWTQQSKGVQIIRAGAIIQLLLGNIGRPGGGILALRGHACIQGATDISTLYDLLAGYMPQPAAMMSAQPHTQQSKTVTTWGEKTDVSANMPSQQTLQEYIDSSGEKLGWWSNFPVYIRSLLHAWYG